MKRSCAGKGREQKASVGEAAERAWEDEGAVDDGTGIFTGL